MFFNPTAISITGKIIFGIMQVLKPSYQDTTTNVTH
jgi:hypothetical protein